MFEFMVNVVQKHLAICVLLNRLHLLEVQLKDYFQ